MARGVELYDDVEAIPLVLPDFVNIRPKNPEIELRWVNYNVGERQKTLRYDQLKAAGFLNAKIEDVDEKTLSDAYKADGGKIINGDLILMKVSKAKYRGWLKWNQENALRLSGRKDINQRGTKTIKDALDAAGAPRELRNKISAFVPGGSELDAAINSPATPKPNDANAHHSPSAVKPPNLSPPAGASK